MGALHFNGFGQFAHAAIDRFEAREQIIALKRLARLTKGQSKPVGHITTQWMVLSRPSAGQGALNLADRDLALVAHHQNALDEVSQFA